MNCPSVFRYSHIGFPLIFTLLGLISGCSEKEAGLKVPPPQVPAPQRGDYPELGDIISKAMNERDETGFLDWTFMAREETPIEWETEGVGDYRRTGSALLAVNGFIPERLERTVKPAKWNIEAVGSKFGIHTLEFESDACFGSGTSDRCNQRLTMIEESLTLAGLKSSAICEFGPGSQRTKVFRITSESGKTAYLSEEIGGGSGGITVEYVLIPTPEQRVKQMNASAMEVDSAMCGVLFERNSGKHSGLSEEIRYLLKM